MPARTAPFWLLAATTMTGTAALHGIIPVLPAIAVDFDVTPRTAQYAITLYLIGMATGQLVYGPLSDRFGRRPLLLCSQAVYIAGLLLAAVARQIAPHVPIVRAARLGNRVCLAAAALLALVCVTGALSLVAMMTLLVIYAIGIGIMSPNCLAGLMNARPERAGTASSLYGFLQMACGTAFTLFVSVDYVAPGFPVALSLLVASGCAALSLAGLVRDEG